MYLGAFQLAYTKENHYYKTEKVTETILNVFHGGGQEVEMAQTMYSHMNK
jgi:hypothetical protein